MDRNTAIQHAIEYLNKQLHTDLPLKGVVSSLFNQLKVDLEQPSFKEGDKVLLINQQNEELNGQIGEISRVRADRCYNVNGVDEIVNEDDLLPINEVSQIHVDKIYNLSAELKQSRESNTELTVSFLSAKEELTDLKNKHEKALEMVSMHSDQLGVLQRCIDDQRERIENDKLVIMDQAKALGAMGSFMNVNI